MGEYENGQIKINISSKLKAEQINDLKELRDELTHTEVIDEEEKGCQKTNKKDK